jgi:glycosyltransferase involved in cell wall biosynthesis
MVLVLARMWQSFCSEVCSNPNIRILYNGALPEKFSGKIDHGSAINISFMGRLGERKGTYDLLTAFERLSPENPRVRLVLGGDGDVDRVRELVRKNGLESKVDVLGWVSGEEKINVFRKADVYVLPSYNEGLPGSVLEAMAAGVAIVSTTVGGIPELVDENRNGYLITPGDTETLYTRLSALSRDEELRTRMGRESTKKIAEQFSITVIVQTLIGLYHELMKNRKTE